MKIEKLPSGSYRIRKMYKGKTYTVTFEGKPTQKEAMMAMATKLEQVQEKNKTMTFESAAKKYIESRKNILSPSTVSGYYKIINRIPESFLSMNIYDIEPNDIQKETNRVSENHSPKTVRNHHGFISAVLGAFRPNMRIYTTLPQKSKNEPYIPSREDVKRILEYAKGSQFEIPIVLACYGMRRSEICALSVDDVEGDILHINKALVQRNDKEWVVKPTKTTESTRDIVIPMEIANKIRKQGYIYKGHPSSITRYLEQVEKSLDIPHFTLHKLRHYFASQMSALGVPEADIMKMGGWESDHVMKSVYRHSMMEKDEDAKRKASDNFRKSLYS